MSYDYDVLTGLLAMNDTFTPGEKLTFTFDFSAPGLTVLKEKYALEKLVVPENDFKTIQNLLAFVSQHITHGNDANEGVPRNALGFLTHAFDKPEHVLNCKEQSITLAECFLAVKIPAYPIWEFPYSPYDMDNHVVVQVYSTFLKKWVMVDPTHNLYLSNEKGEYLDIFQLRKALAHQETLRLNSSAHYNGNSYDSKEHVEEILTYYAKDLFYLCCYPNQHYGAFEQAVSQHYLVPVGFELNKFYAKNYSYRIQYAQRNPEYQPFISYFEEQKEKMAQQTFHYTSEENLSFDFLKN